MPASTEGLDLVDSCSEVHRLKPDLVLLGEGGTRSNTEDFNASWQTTLTASHEAGGEDDRTCQF